MTQGEYEMKAYLELLVLPPEVRDAVSHLAYEQGHSAGWHEVLCYLGDFISHLQEPLQRLEKRIRKEAKG